MAEWSMPGSRTSSTYFPLPRIKRPSSLRGIRSPKVCPCMGVVAILSAHLLSGRVARGPLDRLDYVLVSGAAAEVAGDGLPDLLFRRVGVPLDGGHLVPVGPDGQHGARLDRLAVEVHGTRSAVGRVTPPVGARQPEVIPDKVDQEQPRLDVRLPQLAVDVYLDPHRIPFLSRPLDGRLQRPTDQNLHQVLLKGHGAAGVLDRVALLGGSFPGPLVQLRVRTLSSEQLLGFASPERRASDAAHPDSYVFYLSAAHVQRHAYRRRGVVAGPALDLDVGARVGHPRDTGLGDDLARFEDRLVEAGVQFVYGNSPLAVGAAHHDLAAYSHERRRQVLPRVSVGH